MLLRPIVLVSLVLLAGCGKEDGAKKAAQESAATPAAVAETIKIKPGAWDATTELVSMEVDGVDPAMLKGNVGRKTEFKNCVTPEQAARPASDFFAHPDLKNGNCKSESFDMAGGKLSAVIVCQSGEGQAGPMRMELSGNYAPDSYDMTVTMNGKGGPNGATMKMVAHSSGKHVADTCAS
ncbi:DUF3617 domain-containing protein [Sphingomonas sp. KC8]|uniref:DUF3617 domain-containing protein n=1 Tax=Sphingomonas sp. KC8 TaxID=1030157 RepID=UPI000248B57C|nr:DUF3617 domain-containing protein [Sphingomonas sp. KC8]ARS28450.1 hypothetical protein KC8_14305 [Sphingomonas sp. KC8]